MARFSRAHYEALARREHLNSTEVSERIRRETGKRIHPEIVEQNLPCVVNNRSQCIYIGVGGSGLQ